MEKGALGTCFGIGQTTMGNTTMVERRPGDDQRLIGAWLTAGVMHEGKVTHPDCRRRKQRFRSEGDRPEGSRGCIYSSMPEAVPQLLQIRAVDTPGR